MGKRGRPPKRKVVENTIPKAEQCYMILSSDEEAGTGNGKKEEILRVPSPSQRRGIGNERNGSIFITPPDRTTSSTDVNEKSPILIRNSNKKKIILNGNNKKADSSGDSDATEVYVYNFLFFKIFLSDFLC